MFRFCSRGTFLFARSIRTFASSSHFAHSMCAPIVASVQVPFISSAVSYVRLTVIRRSTRLVCAVFILHLLHINVITTKCVFDPLIIS